MPELPPPPAARMPTWKAVLIYSIAAVTDFIKFIFALFIFAAPFLTSAAVALWTSSHHWPSWASWLASVAAGATTGVLEVVAAPFTGAVETFGIIMAMLAGLFGWLVLIMIFLLSRINPFHVRTFFKTMVGLIGSEVPILDFIPTVTPAVFFIVRDARRADRRALADWEEAVERASEEQRERAAALQAAYAARAEEALQESEIPEALPEPA